MQKNKTIAIGIGNTLRKDDGVGPFIIEKLKQIKNLNAELIDCQTDNLALIDYFENYENAVIIDAVDMGLAHGDYKIFTPDEIILSLKSGVLSTHGFGLKEILILSNNLGLKTNIKILGVQYKDISYGEGLSVEIQNNIDKIIELIKTQLV